MNVKEESEKVGVKLNILKIKIMASGPITLWQIDGETMETVTEFILGGCKITADGNCSHEIKRRWLLGRKAMTNLDSILKSRHYFAKKGPSSQSNVFSSSHVWMWELDYKESWAPKNRCFWMWCWRRLLKVLCTARRSNQSILKEISPEYSLEGLMLKLKLQYFGHLMWRINSLEKTLILGKIEGWRSRDKRGWDGWMASLTLWTWVWVSSRSWWQTRNPSMLQSRGSQGVGHYWVTELNWSTYFFKRC